MSRALGVLADATMPLPLRSASFHAWGVATGSDSSEVLLPPRAHPSLAAYFVRRLSDGARAFPADPAWIASPVDGAVQALDPVTDGCVLQAKGQPYSVRDLLADPEGRFDLEGAIAVTLYLAPRDYHRIHSPTDADLVGVRWIGGTRYSVRPSVLAARARVLTGNERAVLQLETRAGPLFLVLVGALNVGRIRVVGVPFGASPAEPRRFRRGDELARFEMGSTVVAFLPRTVHPVPDLAPGARVRLGAPLAGPAGDLSSRASCP